jgi:predicted membrane-bound spermidine synthase
MLDAPVFTLTAGLGSQDGSSADEGRPGLVYNVFAYFVAVAVEIDDSLPPLERFKTYLNSSLILHRYGAGGLVVGFARPYILICRLHVLREAGEIAGLIGYAATVQHIIPCIHPLTQEPVSCASLL